MTNCLGRRPLLGYRELASERCNRSLASWGKSQWSLLATAAEPQHIDMLMVFKYSLKVCPSLYAGLQNDSLSSCICHCGLTRNVDSGVRAIFKLLKNPIASIRMSESPILLSEEREVESER